MRGNLVLLPSNRQHELLNSCGLNRLGVPQALEHLGYKVDFLDVHKAPLNPLAGKPSLFSSIDPLRAIRVLIGHRKAKAVISYYQSGALLILALRRWFGFRPKVAIIDIGDDTGWRVRTRIVAYCIARADVVFTFASEQAAYLSRKYATDNVRFLRQQVDTEFFTPSSSETGGYVLMVGSDASRDLGTLKEALFDRGIPLVLRTGLPVPDCPATVTLVRENLADTGLRDLYRKAEIVVLPLVDTLYPGGITTLLEAFACGKAVVVSDARGVRDYLSDGVNCLVVPCGDAIALREAVERLVADPEMRERLGQGARAYAEQELSQQRHAERLASALHVIFEEAKPADRSGRRVGAVT
jgi:glycosyltransferase involved in cell wall biosynthesis